MTIVWTLLGAYAVAGIAFALAHRREIFPTIGDFLIAVATGPIVLVTIAVLAILTWFDKGNDAGEKP